MRNFKSGTKIEFKPKGSEKYHRGQVDHERVFHDQRCARAGIDGEKVRYDDETECQKLLDFINDPDGFIELPEIKFPDWAYNFYGEELLRELVLFFHEEVALQRNHLSEEEEYIMRDMQYDKSVWLAIVLTNKFNEKFPTAKGFDDLNGWKNFHKGMNKFLMGLEQVFRTFDEMKGEWKFVSTIGKMQSMVLDALAFTDVTKFVCSSQEVQEDILEELNSRGDQEDAGISDYDWRVSFNFQYLREALSLTKKEELSEKELAEITREGDLHYVRMLTNINQFNELDPLVEDSEGKFILARDLKNDHYKADIIYRVLYSERGIELGNINHENSSVEVYSVDGHCDFMVSLRSNELLTPSGLPLKDIFISLGREDFYQRARLEIFKIINQRIQEISDLQEENDSEEEAIAQATRYYKSIKGNSVRVIKVGDPETLREHRTPALLVLAEWLGVNLAEDEILVMEMKGEKGNVDESVQANEPKINGAALDKRRVGILDYNKVMSTFHQLAREGILRAVDVKGGKGIHTKIISNEGFSAVVGPARRDASAVAIGTLYNALRILNVRRSEFMRRYKGLK